MCTTGPERVRRRGALLLRCTLWRAAAENAAQSLTKGKRVIVTGRLKQRTFDHKESQRRTTVEIMPRRSRR
ncbi:single-stranded DNA-binding protein [Streptomyces sp. NRRL F-2664]|uniref:single-stranded DNA-binding protein n=1 Tax=Streptomyces sp. NRRL F-2664 TaxID=1463842 RepID=UPI000AED84B5|nr:single-stranded DNA-binding protein [Streptomyces sp. NRRL F-2664]